MREIRTYGSVRGVEIYVYSTKRSEVYFTKKVFSNREDLFSNFEMLFDGSLKATMLMNLSQLYKKENNLSKAEEIRDWAISMDNSCSILYAPIMGHLHSSMGLCFLHNGDKNNARDYYKEAIKWYKKTGNSDQVADLEIIIKELP